MDLEVRLAELLCTRLCHDLTGPIGAVNNGAEFLGEEGFTLHDQALELIIGSAKQAVIRLQFYRQVYGRVNSQGEASLTEMRELANAFFGDSRFQLVWPKEYTDSAGISLSRRMAKVVLNMLIFISGIMPRGGGLSVQMEQNENGQVKISVRGEGVIREDDEALKVVENKTDIADITPKTVQAYFMVRLAESLNISLSHSYDNTHFEMVALHM